MSAFYDGPFDYDDLPDPPDDFGNDNYEAPLGAFIGGQWVDVDDLPRGYGKSPDWWDDSCGETYEEYLEHED